MSITRMVLLTLGAAVAAVPNSATPSKSCGAGEFRQFDFFAGDWDAYDVAAPSKVVARNKVTIVLGGCVLHEVYEQSDGLVGESFSLYDASREVWHQTWVTNRGALLLLEGGLDGGRMVLTGPERAADGGASLLRGTWRPNVGAVRETRSARATAVRRGRWCSICGSVGTDAPAS